MQVPPLLIRHKWIMPTLVLTIYIALFIVYHWIEEIRTNVPLWQHCIGYFFLIMSLWSFIKLLAFDEPGYSDDANLVWTHVIVNEQGKITILADQQRATRDLTFNGSTITTSSSSSSSAASNSNKSSNSRLRRHVLWSTKKVPSSDPQQAEHTYAPRRTTNAFHYNLPDLSSFDRDEDTGNIRVCNICNRPQPDRAHHSKLIGRCVLRFDHYCLFVSKAIGYMNYKDFLLFLLYVSGLTLYASLTFTFDVLVPRLVNHANHAMPATTLANSIHILMLAILLGGISLTTFIMLYYMTNGMLNNTTYIERLRYADTDMYDMGWRDNFESIFGSPSLWYKWALPIHSTPGNGATWKSKANSILDRPTPPASPTLTAHAKVDDASSSMPESKKTK